MTRIPLAAVLLPCSNNNPIKMIGHPRIEWLGARQIGRSVAGHPICPLDAADRQLPSRLIIWKRRRREDAGEKLISRTEERSFSFWQIDVYPFQTRPLAQSSTIKQKAWPLAGLGFGLLYICLRMRGVPW